MMRPFVPLIKKYYGNAGARPPVENSPSIMDSGPYRLYCRLFYPIERAFMPALAESVGVSICCAVP
jgi:hypothetical protein